MSDEISDDWYTEDQIKTGIGIEHGRVVILWTKKIATISFDPDSADQFADAIKKKAQEARDLTN